MKSTALKETKKKQAKEKTNSEFIFWIKKKRASGANATRKGVVYGRLVSSNKDKVNLLIGWSLCNNKEGDRYNPELALSLAIGRAMSADCTSSSFKAKIDSKVTSLDIIRARIPQSAIVGIQSIVAEAKEKHDVDMIYIFSSKDPRVGSEKPLW